MTVDGVHTMRLKTGLPSSDRKSPAIEKMPPFQK